MACNFFCRFIMLPMQPCADRGLSKDFKISVTNFSPFLDLSPPWNGRFNKVWIPKESSCWSFRRMDFCQNISCQISNGWYAFQAVDLSEYSFQWSLLSNLFVIWGFLFAKETKFLLSHLSLFNKLKAVLMTEIFMQELIT